VQEATRLLEEGAYADAVRQCREGLKARPRSNEGRLLLGLGLLGLENYLDLLVEAEQAASLAPDDPLAHRLLGEALLALGRHGEARAALDTARELASPGQEKDQLWSLLERVCDAPPAGADEGSGGRHEVPVMSEPESWGDDDDFTNIMDDPPDLAAMDGAEEGTPEEDDDDERYTTAPWLPPSYLERMRKGEEAEEDLVGYDVGDEETVSEVLTPVPEGLEILNSEEFEQQREQADEPEMVDDNDTVSLADDYQALLNSSSEEVADASHWDLPDQGEDAGPGEEDGLGEDDGISDTDHGSGEHPPISEEEAIAVLTGEPTPSGDAIGAGEPEEGGTQELLDGEILEMGPDEDEDPTVAGELVDISVEEEQGELDLIDDDETGVGVDQELLLASMEQAAKAPPRVQQHADDDSSALLVDSGLLTEWTRAEGDGLEPQASGEEGTTDTTAADEPPTMAEEAPGTEESELLLEQSEQPWGEAVDDLEDTGFEDEEDEWDDEATVAQGPEPLGALDSTEEVVGSEWEEDPGEPTVAQINPVVDSDEASAEEEWGDIDDEGDPTVARGPEPLGPLDEEDDGEPTVARGPEPLGPLDEDDDGDPTVARGPEPLGPLDEEDPGEPTMAQASPISDQMDGVAPEGAWADEDDEGEPTVIREDSALVPAGPFGDGAGDEFEPLDSEELSEISLEMVIDEDDLPPLPPPSGVEVDDNNPEEGWGDPAEVPAFEGEEEYTSGDDPFTFDDDDEEEYAEATQVRVELPKLQAIVSDVDAASPRSLLPGGEDGVSLNPDGSLDDDDMQEEATGFYREENAQVAFPEVEDAPSPNLAEPGEGASIPEAYGEPGLQGAPTPVGVEGFPGDAAPYGEPPASPEQSMFPPGADQAPPPQHLPDDPYDPSLPPSRQFEHLPEEPYDISQPGQPEQPAAPQYPPAQSVPPEMAQASTVDIPSGPMRVERTENLRASTPGPSVSRAPAPAPGAPAEVYDARAGAEARVKAPEPKPRAKPKPKPTKRTLPRLMGGNARLDRAARTGTNLVAMLKGRPGSKRLPVLVVCTIGVIVLAFGIGRVVRHMRLGDQIEDKRGKAAQLLWNGNMVDYAAASRSYAEILKHRPEDKAAYWAQSRVQAAIPVEFGDPNPQAARRVAQTDKPGADRLAADIYAALFTGSLARANKLLEQGRVARPEAAILAYLEGRVRMLEGKAEAALASLDRAVKTNPLDTLHHLWRAEALAELGKVQKSLNAHAGTLKLNADHVGTLIARARVLLESRGDMNTAQKDLETILSGARSALSSKGQRGWAAVLMARILLTRGDSTRARTFLTKARTNQPTRDPLFLDQLAQAYLESYQMGEAERVIQESRDLLPGRPHPHFHLARVYLLQGRSARSLASLNRARGLTSPAAALLRARILYSLGRHQEALAELDGQKGNLRASLVRAEILASMGKGREAEQGLLGLLPTNRRSVELLTALGEVYLQIGRTHQARQRLGEAVRLDRFAFRARLKLAEVDLAEGKYSDAHKRLAEAARTNKGNTVAMRKLADLEFVLGNLPKARELYTTLVKRSANDPEVRLGYARVLAAQQETSLADVEIRAAEARQADRIKTALVRGEFALLQGKAGLAITHLTTATGGTKPSAEALHLRVRAHLMNNDEHSAKAAVQRLASLYAGTPEALDAAGRVDLYAGSFSRASRTFGQALQALRTAPRPPLMHAAMLVMAGRAQHDSGRSDRAMARYEEAARICPRCAEPHYRIGLVHDENERQDAAISSLRRAKSLAPKMKEVYYDLGSVLERASRISEAAAAYRTYLSLKPPKELADAAKEALENLGQ